MTVIQIEAIGTEVEPRLETNAIIKTIRPVELAAFDARCGVDLRFCTMAAASSEGRNSGNQQAR
ncbi:hypothetical protein [Lacipirellula limnantheis]|uniref:hypothetical protein n=1 Tax=Lacipirellula limnantheis TaxID=2528024 RepID=UPI0011AA1E65|nr:hypothetical protein [Lacipirellula limnantheis]